LGQLSHPLRYLQFNVGIIIAFGGGYMVSTKKNKNYLPFLKFLTQIENPISIF